MQVILKQEVEGLGTQYDIVDVKPGYARNYLIPRGYAVIANKSSRKETEEILRQQSQKLQKVKDNAQAIADSIGDLTIEIRMKAGESGKIFGSVTPLQIAEQLENKGFNVDRKKIALQGDVKTLGEFKAVLDLHKEIKHEITISVVREEEA